MGCGTSKSAAGGDAPPPPKRSGPRRKRLTVIDDGQKHDLPPASDGPSAGSDVGLVVHYAANDVVVDCKLNDQDHQFHLDYCATTAAGMEGGNTKENQDSVSIEDNIKDENGMIFFAVYDGHGQFGAKASRFVKQRMVHNISEAPAFKDGDYVKSLHYAFHKTNSDLKRQRIDLAATGSTGCTILMVREKIYIANVGDSRAVAALVNEEGKIVKVDALSRDHKPTIPAEQERIESCGGVVCPIEIDGETFGPPRVWIKGQQAPGLCMSRSLGDELAASVGIVCDPEISVRKLDSLRTAKELWIVIGSDGIYEFISNEDILAMAIKHGPAVRDSAAYIIKTSRAEWLDQEEDVIDDCSAVVHKMRLIRKEGEESGAGSGAGSEKVSSEIEESK